MSETGHFSKTVAFDKITWKRLNTLKLVEPRADGNRSEMVRILVNEEWERRGLPSEAGPENVQLVHANGHGV